MTREEFTERVGLNVSDGIFEVWNGVYMSSDKDKDEFCKPFATKKGHLDLSRSMVIEIAELKKKIRVQKESYAGKHGKIDPVGTDEIDPVKTA